VFQEVRGRRSGGWLEASAWVVAGRTLLAASKQVRCYGNRSILRF